MGAPVYLARAIQGSCVGGGQRGQLLWTTQRACLSLSDQADGTPKNGRPTADCSI